MLLHLSYDLQRRYRGANQRGAVFVEHVIAFIPMFIFFLGITQLAFLSAAKLAVQGAANKAVRAAIVAEPLPKRNCPSGDPGNTDRLFAGNNELPDPFNKKANSNPGQPSAGTPLLTRVRSAAYVPLAALAPAVFIYPVGQIARDMLSAFPGQQTMRFAAGYYVYNRSHAAITFRDAAGQNVDAERFAENDLVRVHILYLQHCMIPIVNRIMCKPLTDLAGFSRVLDNADPFPPLEEIVRSDGKALNEYASRRAAQGRDVSDSLKKAERIYSGLLKAEYPQMLLAWLSPSLRFVPLEADSNLPAQYAAYVDLCQTN